MLPFSPAPSRLPSPNLLTSFPPSPPVTLPSHRHTSFTPPTSLTSRCSFHRTPALRRRWKRRRRGSRGKRRRRTDLHSSSDRIAPLYWYIMHVRDIICVFFHEGAHRGSIRSLFCDLGNAVRCQVPGILLVSRGYFILVVVAGNNPCCPMSESV